MARRTAVTQGEDGQTVTLQGVTATDGDYFDNQQSEVKLLLHNDHATDDSTFTVHANGTTSVDVPEYGTLTKEDVDITVPAGEYRYAGPFPGLAYNGDTGAGNANAHGLLITATGGTPELAGVI